MGLPSIRQQFFIVGQCPGGQGIVQSHYPLRVDQNGSRFQTIMLDIFFLEVTQPQDATGKYRPQFLLLKLPLLKHSLVDFIFESSLGELPKSINLVECHAILILLASDNPLQVGNMLVVFELFLPLVQQLFSCLEDLFILAVDLTKEVLLLSGSRL
jgi:hypothetical protein